MELTGGGLPKRQKPTHRMKRSWNSHRGFPAVQAKTPEEGVTKLSRRRQLQHQPLSIAHRKGDFRRRAREACKKIKESCMTSKRSLLWFQMGDARVLELQKAWIRVP